MGEVIDFNKNKPTQSGPAICLQCQHEWVGVTEVGDNVFECPECGTHKGVWQGLCRPPDGTPAWICTRNGCGNEFYRLLEDRAYCAKCGSQHFYSDIWTK